jgi:hypothetical protein
MLSSLFALVLFILSGGRDDVILARILEASQPHLTRTLSSLPSLHDFESDGATGHVLHTLKPH